MKTACTPINCSLVAQIFSRFRFDTIVVFGGFLVLTLSLVGCSTTNLARACYETDAVKTKEEALAVLQNIKIPEQDPLTAHGNPWGNSKGYGISFSVDETGLKYSKSLFVPDKDKPVMPGDGFRTIPGYIVEAGSGYYVKFSEVGRMELKRYLNGSGKILFYNTSGAYMDALVIMRTADYDMVKVTASLLFFCPNAN